MFFELCVALIFLFDGSNGAKIIKKNLYIIRMEKLKKKKKEIE